MRLRKINKRGQSRGVFSVFMAIIIIQLFYSFSITTLAYSMPADALDRVTSFSDVGSSLDLEETAELLEGSLEQQTNIPVIELGALVFYSGNILLDLMLNFAFAVPQMIGLLLQGLMGFLNIDGALWAYAQIFLVVAFSAFYTISLIQMLLGLRSGSAGGLV